MAAGGAGGGVRREVVVELLLVAGGARGEHPAVEGVVEEDLEDGHEGLDVGAERGEKLGGAGEEGSVGPLEAHAVENVASESERDGLGNREGLALLEGDAKVDVDDLGGVGGDEDVLGVSVADAERVANDGGGRNALGVGPRSVDPGLGVAAKELDKKVPKRGPKVVADVSKGREAVVSSSDVLFPRRSREVLVGAVVAREAVDVGEVVRMVPRVSADVERPGLVVSSRLADEVVAKGHGILDELDRAGDGRERDDRVRSEDRTSFWRRRAR